MKQFSLKILLAISLILGGLNGSVMAAAAPEPSVNLSPSQWVNHNFVFLELPADKQAEGYEIFAADQAIRGFQQDRSVRIPYLQHVGKVVTVTDVSAYTSGDNMYDYVVSMTEVGTGNKYVGRTIRGSLEGLALVEDIEEARKQFLGKTIYPKSRSLVVANAQTGSMAPTSVAIPIGAAVTVTDVCAGIQSKEPLWLIVSVNGQKAILPIAYSWTNQTETTWEQNPPWQAALFMEDPHNSLGGSTDVWQQIEAGMVQEEMTSDQVRLSWGPPNRVDQSVIGSVWFYGSKVLEFSGNKLTSTKTVVSLDRES